MGKGELRAGAGERPLKPMPSPPPGAREASPCPLTVAEQLHAAGMLGRFLSSTAKAQSWQALGLLPSSAS